MGAQKRTSTAAIAAMPDVHAPRGVRQRPEARPPSSKASDYGIEQLCLDRGLKMTAHRRVIARVLADANDHLDVQDVYCRALLFDRSICLATVYRTMRIFEEKSIIQRHNFCVRRARYELADHSHHYHLIDVKSGEVMEFSNATHEWLIQAIVESLGFEIVSLRLEVFGKRLNAQPWSGNSTYTNPLKE